MKTFFHKHKNRFSKFCLVGATGVLVNEGLLFFFTDFMGLFYLISSFIGIEASIITNFILNDSWTFKHQRKERKFKRLLKFNLVSFGGIVLNLAVLFVLTNYFGFYYLISNLFGISAAVLWNYFVNLAWTYKI